MRALMIACLAFFLVACSSTSEQAADVEGRPAPEVPKNDMGRPDGVLKELDVTRCQRELATVVQAARAKDGKARFDQAVVRARYAAEHDLEDAILSALEEPDRVERVDVRQVQKADPIREAAREAPAAPVREPFDASEPPTMPMGTSLKPRRSTPPPLPVPTVRSSASATGARSVAPPMSQTPLTATPSMYPRMLFDLPNVYATATWCHPALVKPALVVQRCHSAGLPFAGALENRNDTRASSFSPFSRRA